MIDNLQKTIARLEAKILSQASEINHQKLKINHQQSEIENQQSEIENKESKIDNLKTEILILKAALYGKKSEKLNSSDIEETKQLILPDLFNEAESHIDAKGSEEEDDVEITDSTEIIKTGTVKKKKKAGRKALPKDLPRKEVIHDLSEEAKQCHCGCLMNKIGFDSSEELDYIPAKIQVLHHIRYKYACRSCSENVQIAPSPLKVIDKGIGSSGLLSYSLISKFEDHLPYYRQSKMWLRNGIDLSDQTLCNWHLQCSDLLLRIVSVLKSDMLLGNYICSDETPLRVLLSENSNNYMWVHHSGPRKNRAIIYDYHESRSGSCAEGFLSDFKGIHQCDGYSGYNILYKKGSKILRAGCMDHARRKFYDLYKAGGKKAGFTKDILSELKLLYKIEADCIKQELPPDKIKERRQKLSKPILAKLRILLENIKCKTSEKSLLGKAVGYMLLQWEALTLYLDYGHIRISNADAERIIKPFTIGRKNWLFNKTKSGAKASATIYSIIETCKANNINTYRYLKYVLPELKKIQKQPNANITKLLPYNIDPNLI